MNFSGKSKYFLYILLSWIKIYSVAKVLWRTQTTSFITRSSILNITLLRQTWNVIETTNASELLEVEETELIGLLVNRLDAQKPLADRERTVVNNYLHSKMGLIKDTAEARLVST